MKNWKRLLVLSSTSIFEATKVLNDFCQFAVVVDENLKLLGTVTDGDLRRGILKGIDLKTSAVTEIMNKNPISAGNSAPLSEIYQGLGKLESRVTMVPLVNAQGIVTGMFSLEEEEESANSNIPVIIMAGGLGSRLGEMTKATPKPMLKIDGVPILEIIINNLKRSKFHDFYISVNYKSEVIEEYFKDGRQFGVNVHYIHEPKKLGTAGCLSLVNFESDHVVVVNGDVLTHVNFNSLIEFHAENKSIATMCVREYSYTIPFGVVQSEEGKIVAIEEKPSQTVFVNAGIYVLSKDALKLIPQEEYFDMPSLFAQVLKSGKNAMTFPVHEYWTDIGHKEDFLKAQEEYKTLRRGDR